MSIIKKEAEIWSAAATVYLSGWLPDDRDTPVLDIGCGTGNFLYFLEKLGYRDLTGVDMDVSKIREAGKCLPRSTLIVGDARKILMPHFQHFGLITGFDVIEHFPKGIVKELFALVSQALTPGGRVIFQTPNAESPWSGGGGLWRSHPRMVFHPKKPEGNAGSCWPQWLWGPAVRPLCSWSEKLRSRHSLEGYPIIFCLCKHGGNWVHRDWYLYKGLSGDGLEKVIRNEIQPGYSYITPDSVFVAVL